MDGIHSSPKDDTYATRRMVAQRMISTQRSVLKEHGFDTEGGGGEGGFNTGGGGKKGSFNMQSGSGEDGSRGGIIYSTGT